MKALFFSFLFFIAANSCANEVQVTNIEVKPLSDQQYRFDVTLLHDDTGWKHYANRWEILDLKGNILATRTLHHPHVNEQPFTRSLTVTLPVTSPENSKTVIVRGHDSVHQYKGNEIKVSIP